jgi:hypothetical protein
MERRLWLSLGAAFVGGLAMTFIALYCWGYIAAYSPVPRWLLDLGLHDIGARVVLFPIDFITSVALSMPLAFLLVALRPRKLWLYLPVAIVPSFIWLNIPLLGHGVFYELVPWVVLGWLHTLFALPVATLLVSQLAKPGAPNNLLHATCEDARA